MLPVRSVRFVFIGSWFLFGLFCFALLFWFPLPPGWREEGEVRSRALGSGAREGGLQAVGQGVFMQKMGG